MWNKTITTISMLTLAFASKGQITGGGQLPTTSKNERVQETNAEDYFPNKIIFGYSSTRARGDFGRPIRNTSDIVLEGRGGMDRGFGFTLASIFYLNEIDYGLINMENHLRLGIHAKYLDYQFLSIGEDFLDNQIEAENRANFFNFGIGPILTYRPFGKFAIDFGYTMDPSILLFNRTIYAETPVGDFLTIYELAEDIDFGIRHSINLHIKYGVMLFGLNWRYGRQNVEIYHRQELGLSGSTWDYFQDVPLSTSTVNFFFALDLPSKRKK